MIAVCRSDGWLMIVVGERRTRTMNQISFARFFNSEISKARVLRRKLYISTIL